MINKHFSHLELRNTFLRKKKTAWKPWNQSSHGHTERQRRQRESCQRKRFILQFAAEKNFSPDRKDIYIIKEDKNMLAFISLILIQYI